MAVSLYLAVDATLHGVRSVVGLAELEVRGGGGGAGLPALADGLWVLALVLNSVTVDAHRPVADPLRGASWT